MTTKKTADRSFTWERGGKTIVAPYLEDVMNAGLLRRLRDKSIQDQMFALVEEGLDEANLAVFDTLPLTRREGDDPEAHPTMDEFYTAWQEDAGITAGE